MEGPTVWKAKSDISVSSQDSSTHLRLISLNRLLRYLIRLEEYLPVAFLCFSMIIRACRSANAVRGHPRSLDPTHVAHAVVSMYSKCLNVNPIIVDLFDSLVVMSCEEFDSMAASEMTLFLLPLTCLHHIFTFFPSLLQ